MSASFLFRFDIFQKGIQAFQSAPFLRQILGQFRRKKDILHAASVTDNDVLLFIPALSQGVQAFILDFLIFLPFQLEQGVFVDFFR